MKLHLLVLSLLIFSCGESVSYSKKVQQPQVCTLFKSLYEYFLNPDERMAQVKMEINNILKDPKLSPEEAQKQAIEHYRAYRLSLLPTDIQEAMKKLSFTKEYSPPSYDAIRAFANYMNKQLIFQTLPERYKDSLIHFYLEAHEFEHLIYLSAAEARGHGADLQNTLYEMSTIEESFHFELGAMLGEHHLVQVLPPETLASMRAEIEKDGELGAYQKGWFLYNLVDGSPEQFIERQHKVGRYSREALKSDAFWDRVDKAIVPATAGALGLLGSFLGEIGFCTYLDHHPNVDYPNGRKFCKDLDKLMR